MNQLESVPVEEKEPLPRKYAEIIDGPPINDYIRRQIQLAIEKFWMEHPNDNLDLKTVEKIMMSWSDKDLPTHYSEIWNEFVNHPDFKDKHLKYKGDYSMVTLSELEEFERGDRKFLP